MSFLKISLAILLIVNFSCQIITKTKSIATPRLIGGYQDMEFDQCNKAFNRIVRKYPGVENLESVKCQRQIVSGTNWRLVFIDIPNEQFYAFVVYYSLNKNLKATVTAPSNYFMFYQN